MKTFFSPMYSREKEWYATSGVLNNISAIATMADVGLKPEKPLDGFCFHFLIVIEVVAIF
jgi:hypothetical protein